MQKSVSPKMKLNRNKSNACVEGRESHISFILLNEIYDIHGRCTSSIRAGSAGTEAWTGGGAVTGGGAMAPLRRRSGPGTSSPVPGSLLRQCYVHNGGFFLGLSLCLEFLAALPRQRMRCPTGKSITVLCCSRRKLVRVFVGRGGGAGKGGG